MTVTIQDDRHWHTMPETISLMYNLVRVSILSVSRVGMKCADMDDSESHNHNLQAILTNGVASYSIPSDKEYVEGFCDQ
uniref:Uncharacterized protein n=1 Tax=Tanacetum cinerariifolium TaxID=118510 RepID=A0A699KXJ2_TANCI|nr:hypothetical protein [Tanacetum cinerariifolium]